MLCSEFYGMKFSKLQIAIKVYQSYQNTKACKLKVIK